MRRIPMINRLFQGVFVVMAALALSLYTVSVAKAAPQAEPALTIVTPLTITPINPIAGKVVTARFAVRNDGSEPVFLLHLGVAGRAPGCVDFKCGDEEDFLLAKDVTIAPGETYSYEEQRTFLVEGAYFFQLTYEAVIYEWRFLGQRIDVNVGPGLRLSKPLILTPANPAAGDPALATFEVTNAGTAAITLLNLVAGVRGPNCVPADWSCTSRPDFSAVDSLVLDPGASFAYSASHTYTQDGLYFVQVSFIDEAGDWNQMGQRINFTVGDVGGQAATALYLPTIRR